ncbi:hypothetical protein RGQ29_026935 [Quercus rubra]|uniref:F-box domain-containing protein n=1 Tax=Quercus rubra TaxID=3512 RepID=A0AAN7IJZ4_QUERU|nr:hypothetical protein RGQ29_026935 [Quercus rubra]
MANSLSLDEDTVVDRISNLPSSLICHILSFLNTKEAIATSILSSRWKPLWILVPTLDLQDDCRQEPISFTHIVYRVLALHIAPLLRNFSLAWYSPCNSFHLDAWIHTALARNVEHLRLEIYLNGQDGTEFYNGRRFELPRSFYFCRTVVVLELTGGIVLDPPPSFQFPSLKIMSLCEILYRPHYTFSMLLCGCPVLEDLSVTRDGTDGMINFTVSLPTLKRLSIEFYTYERDLPDYKLEIYAPALEYFGFRGDLRNVVFLKKLANLVEAHVEVRAVEFLQEDWVREYEIYYGDRVFKLVRALNNAKFFSLYPGDKECIGFGSIFPSRFQKLARLNFKVNKSNWHVLQALLVVAPDLEVLVLDKHFHFNEDELCWTEPSDDPGYLSSRLTTFKFNGFEGLEHEMEFVKYIINEARSLKTVTINVFDKQSKGSILEELSMFSRINSTTCLLTVE